MTSIFQRDIGDWPTLRGFAETLEVARGFTRGYVFRGHADAEWRLAPTLHRSATLDGTRPLPSAADLLAIEQSLVERFRQEAPALLPHAVLQSTHATIDWWTLMRHYGAPTRLLDWSASFFVAAYFAAASVPMRDGAVFALHLDALNRQIATKYGTEGAFSAATIESVTKKPDASEAIHIVGRATALLDRMIAQQCCFMSSLNVATDIESVLCECVPANAEDGGIWFVKVRIPAALKPEIMRHLRAMNLNAATLFPGLDGVGRALDDIVRNP